MLFVVCFMFRVKHRGSFWRLDNEDWIVYVWVKVLKNIWDCVDCRSINKSKTSRNWGERRKFPLGWVLWVKFEWRYKWRGDDKKWKHHHFSWNRHKLQFLKKICRPKMSFFSNLSGYSLGHMDWDVIFPFYSFSSNKLQKKLSTELDLAIARQQLKWV